MPELPEVETIRQTLKLHVVGRTIAKIDLYYDKIIKGISPAEFVRKLIGQTIRDMQRYGKYLFFVFDDETLVSHLRMEGKYFLKPAADQIEKHEHIVFTFTDGTTMRYHDTRKFGTMELMAKGCERSSKSLCHLGLEPFDEGFTVSYLQGSIKKSIIPVKSLLLDQTVVCGLGNIYVNEVLFLCRLHPETRACDLRETDLAGIIDASRTVLKKAIELGGTTIRTYYSSLGVTGMFQNELHVHDRKGEPCPVCQTPIAKIQVGGRGTYFCPNCQKRRNER
jgi:formamidopyrimidine-DNA glycosylase